MGSSETENLNRSAFASVLAYDMGVADQLLGPDFWRDVTMIRSQDSILIANKSVLEDYGSAQDFTNNI